MTRRPTIIDVAKAAGVSKSTVSLVLQVSPLVRPATREAVQKAMADLGYVYNRSAANLRSPNVGLIGLVINDLGNPLFTDFATAAQQAFAEQGFATVIANSDENPAIQARVVASMIEHGLSGLVIAPTDGGAEPTFAALRRAGIPTLQVLHKADPDTETFPFASFDYAASGAEATRHLIAQGAHKIAFVGGLKDHAITNERMSGYAAAMIAAGLPRLALPGRPTRAFGRDAATMLMMGKRSFEAAVCFNDLVALGVMAGYARAGRKPGSEFRLVGCDGIAECSDGWPQLSTQHCDVGQFARDTAAALLGWLQHGIRPAPETRAAVDLIARASSLG